MLPKRYYIHPLFLIELSQYGLRPQLLQALKALEHKRIRGKSSFLQQLNDLPVESSLDERRLISHFCKIGWLPLQRIIPNRGMREWVEALLFALIVAFTVRTFLFAPFKIPSSSMETTLLVGDHLFASKYSYGIPVPFTDYKLFPKPIQRGDVIIFPFPDNPKLDYIKRVIALEGERLEIQDQQILIDGKPLAEPYAYYQPQLLKQLQLSGLSMSRLPIRIPDQHLFVMGDNRLASADSRVWGFLDQRTVKAKAKRIYWSHDSRQGVFKGYHWKRIGRAIK